MKSKILLPIFGALIAVILAEFVLWLFPIHSDFLNNNSAVQKKHFAEIYSTYSETERDISLGLYNKTTGGECISIRPPTRMNYHARFGFHRVLLDSNCARELLSSATTSVVYLGGSVMANSMAPNYLTTIDYYVSESFPGVASINLAESGARLENELVRMLLEVVDLFPDFVVFVDGYNEFNSVRYGGAPEADFYWTAGVYDRVHRPLHFLFNRGIEASQVLTALLLRTGLWDSPRVPKMSVAPAEIRSAAFAYFANRSRAEQICAAYNIKCLFFLQPFLAQKKFRSPAEEDLLTRVERSFDPSIIPSGYAHLEADSSSVSLLRSLDHVQDTVFFDAVHINKLGNKVLADAIVSELKKYG